MMKARHELAMAGIEKAFFKCTRWQVEETTDIFNCPYHWYCASTYAGDYPFIVDLFVLLLFISLVSFTAMFTVLELSGKKWSFRIGSMTRRYLLPSGPIALPLIVFVLANGHRINTIFPISRMGPALLHLVHVSALAFRNQSQKDISYAVLETSTVSGILHASLYLDSVLLPYYTGLEALTESTFSGVCKSCICRKDMLVVGGRIKYYRGWSQTTFAITMTLCSRIARRIFRQKTSWMIMVMLESISWILIALDGIYLVTGSPQGGLSSRVVYGGIFVLILLSVLNRFVVWVRGRQNIHNSLDLNKNFVRIV